MALTGALGSRTGNNGDIALVQIFGYRETLSLDARARFRLPDELAGMLHRALGRAQARGQAAGPPAAFERLTFYLVPGPGRRVLLYPPTNIHLAVERFENPPAGMDAGAIRQARDYFYDRMRFVEADRQNRLLLPEGLRVHAGIGEEVKQIALVAHNYWLALAPAELVEELTAARLDAFEKMAPELLDPAHRTPPDLSDTAQTD